MITRDDIFNDEYFNSLPNIQIKDKIKLDTDDLNKQINFEKYNNGKPKRIVYRARIIHDKSKDIEKD